MLELRPTRHHGQPGLELSGELTIYTAAQARQELSECLARDPDLALNLSGIEEIDTAGVQLLVWLKRTAAAQGQVLVLAHHSPAVVAVLDLLKVTGELGDPILIAPSAS
jgi:anti-anti-sigma factor